MTIPVKPNGQECLNYYSDSDQDENEDKESVSRALCAYWCRVFTGPRMEKYD